MGVGTALAWSPHLQCGNQTISFIVTSTKLFLIRLYFFPFIFIFIIMKKCKNIECNKEIEKNRIYCSFKCRNYYVNKNLRDYTKNSNGLSIKTKKFYETNLKFCLNPKCNKILSYEKRRNSFCSQSCSTSFTNIGRVVTNETKKRMSISHKNKLEIKTIKCKNCDILIEKRLRKKFCSDNCKKIHNQKDMTEFAKYKQETNFKFSLNDYPNEFDFSLIEIYGWYKPKNKGDNLGGVSRDHMLSVRDGFNRGINPKLLSHPANCQLMIHNENVSKNKKSILTYDELLERIDIWNKKYSPQVL